MPALKDRKQDIAPNIEFELTRFQEKEGNNVTFNREAFHRYLAFAISPKAEWRANFRDLSGSITRMATLAPKGRIDEETVAAEIARLSARWRSDEERASLLSTVFSKERIELLDNFDRMQLEGVIEICRSEKSLSAAGRRLFQASRQEKKAPNDADRLRKYLARFALTYDDVK